MKWNVWHLPSSRWLSFRSWGRRSTAEEYRDLLIEEKKFSEEEIEVSRVFPMLEQHGTVLMKLQPSVIWKCAMDDFERREHNKQADVAGMKPYAFHRKHVEGAESANDIIRAAIADPEIGQRSAKRDTRLLYSDVELLKEALR